MTAAPWPRWSDREYDAPPGEEPGEMDGPPPAGVELERLGPSYLARVVTIGAEFTFRDVRTDRDLTADVSVRARGRHLFRSTVTLSLTGRDRVAKVAHELARSGELAGWKAATHAATEAVLAAEEQIGAPADLRSASLVLPAGGLDVIRPLWPVGSAVIVSPGEAGKSTIGRALAVALAAGVEVIPGLEPIGDPRPTLYVAAEDPVPFWHARSVESICRGAGLDRAKLPEPIELFDTRGRPLHRVVRSIAERAAGFGAVILDSQQALLPAADANGGGIRDRDSLFWHAVDQISVPVLIIAHPNRADARDWLKADGRIAGSEVNRDRSRMAWRVTWQDELAVLGTSFRRYTLHNAKNNHGPRLAPLSFGAAWRFGAEPTDPGSLAFTVCEPISGDAELSPQLAAALTAYRDGCTTPAPLAERLGITVNTAKSRLRLLREKGQLEEVTDSV